ncbi:MAG: biotin--[acetyl-CoA-carboxylase] ligase [Candidatus Thorarchaeota archaeon]|nr:MAG: biotin--[acetyl-CoA-carboxylase] ligase [Candidatus Thorarchaeota archaeon]
MIDLNLLKSGFNLSVLKLQVMIFDDLDSTNVEAKRQIIDGNKQDLLIISSHQTAGKGRLTRTWFSPEGGLYFSLVLKPRLGPQFAPLASLLCGCAVVKGLQSLGIDRVRLKWPNDVLVMEDKIAGILNDLVSIDSVDSWMVLGIGINQNIVRGEFPEDIAWKSTSVQNILGTKTSPEVLMCATINEIDRLFGIVETEKSYSSILELWRTMSSTLGKRVRVDDGVQVITGYAEELLDDGSLVVVTDKGKEKVTMGDVTHLRSD